MQFTKYIALALAAAMPALALPANTERAVGTAFIADRSYLIVNKVEDPTSKRGIAGDQLKNEEGVVFTLVPVDS